MLIGTVRAPPPPTTLPPDRGFPHRSETLLNVLARGQSWVVIVKPAGLRAVPGRAEDAGDSVQSRVPMVWPWAKSHHTPHRLDIETSGLMVIALNKNVFRAIARQFERRHVGKSYTAILDGEVSGESGAIELPLTVDWPNRPRQKICHEEGRPCRTLWRVTRRSEGRTMVEFRPETGRTHQLRVHAASPRDAGGLGCPIAGDTLYGNPDSAPRMLLHASKLGFWAPYTGEWLKFHAPPPFDLSPELRVW